MASHSRQQLEKYLSTLEISADRVLDVGGSQLPISKRVKSWKVGEYRILDLPLPHELKVAADYKVSIETDHDGSFKQFGQFDFVFCLEVMEYVVDPMLVVRNLFNLTKSGGVLYISFPFIYPVHKPKGKDYLRYTRYGAIELLNRAGFKVDHIFSRVANISLNNLWLAEGMRPDMEFPAPQEVGVVIRAIKK